MLEDFKIILKHFKNEKVRFYTILLLGFIVSLTGITIPLALGRFYQLSLQSHSARTDFINNLGLFGNSEKSFLLVFFILIAIRALFVFLYKLFSSNFSDKIVNKLTTNLFNAQIESEWEKFNAKPHGKYLAKYSGDMGSVKNLIEKGIIQFSSDTVFLLLALVIFALLDVQMAIIIIAALVLFVLPFIYFSKKQKPYHKINKDLKAKLTAFVSNSFSNFLSNWAFNKNTLKKNRFEKISNDIIENKRSLNFYQSFIESGSRVLPWVIMWSLMFFILQIEINKNPDPATMLVFFMLLINISYVIRRIMKVGGIWNSGHLSLVSIISWIEETPEKNEKNKLSKKSFEWLVIKNPVAKNEHLKLLSFIVPNTYSIKFDTKDAINVFLENLASGNFGALSEITLDREIISKNEAYPFRKSITFISQLYPITGKDFFDAVLYNQKNEKVEMAKLILAIFDMEHLINCKTFDDAHLNLKELFVLQLCRAICTKKSFVFISNEFVEDFQKSIPKVISHFKEKLPAQAFIELTLRN
jgi:ABC-type multidrug transport system fused ATPase/permease subunit